MTSLYETLQGSHDCCRSYGDFGKLVTGGDDGAVRVWEIDRSNNEERLERVPSAMLLEPSSAQDSESSSEQPSVADNARVNSSRPAQARTLQHFWGRPSTSQ